MNLSKTYPLSEGQIKMVVAMYFGQRVFCWNKGSYSNKKGGPEERLDVITERIIKTYLPDGRLYLIPLSALSREDAVEIWKIEGFTGPRMGMKLYVSKDGELKIKFGDYNAPVHQQTFHYLVQKGYAVPLFFGVNHPNNGKNAKQLGLAIYKKTKQ